jgi:Ferredoxin subunits of nitrite reductase and ring-hydroxylating dioxygenases
LTDTIPEPVTTPRGTRHVIDKLENFPYGDRRVVTIDGRSIGVLNVGGKFYALRNNCPHAGAPLCEGVVKGTMDDTPVHEYRYIRHNEFITCPWHGFEFELETGRSIVDPQKMRVRTYEVAVEDGDVVLYV